MALKAKGKKLLQAAVDYRKPFTSTTTSARWFASWDEVPKGHLPEGKESPRALNTNVFVIFSYDTPIAWSFEDESTWTIPAVEYSVITTNHQNVVRVAAENPFFFANARW